MSLWRLTRTEMAGALRSLRYDLARRAGEHGWHADAGGRSPRVVVASAFGIVAVAGAAGSYLAVVNGLGSLLDEPIGPEPYPLVAEAAAPRTPLTVTPTRTAGADDTAGGSSGSPGRVTAVHRPDSGPATPTGDTATTGAARQPATRTVTVTATVTRPPATTGPTATPGTPSPEPSCDCPNPPVPTPTSPPSPSHGTPPSGGPSPTVTPSLSASVTPRPSAPPVPSGTGSVPPGRPGLR